MLNLLVQDTFYKHRKNKQKKANQIDNRRQYWWCAHIYRFGEQVVLLGRKPRWDILKFSIMILAQIFPNLVKKVIKNSWLKFKKDTATEFSKRYATRYINSVDLKCNRKTVLEEGFPKINVLKKMYDSRPKSVDKKIKTAH